MFLYFASGESLYPGAFLLLILAIISPFLHRRPFLQLRNIAAWVALTMIVMASPPFPWTLDAIFGAALAFWFISVNEFGLGLSVGGRRIAVVVLTGVLLVMTATELCHRAAPAISGAPSDHLVVIGDSISSGIDAQTIPWPGVMQQITGRRVKNLARAGARMIDAGVMADEVMPQDRLVLIEIGGNDLLTGVSACEFANALEATFAKVAVHGRTVVMFELPLLPNKVAFGRVQRRLSSKYGVTLLPKRYFTKVISGTNATSDGLHLSSAGARSMAVLVARILAPVLKPEAR